MFESSAAIHTARKIGIANGPNVPRVALAAAGAARAGSSFGLIRAV
jgi:hypothetical protein